MMNLPRWFIPTGSPIPAHIPTHARYQVFSVNDGFGPGGHGGTLLGGELQAGEPGWEKTTGGWWVNLLGVAPQTLGKLDTHPRILHWRTIAGAHPHHYLMVPVLLKPVYEADEPVAYQSALDRTWHNGEWTDVQDLRELQERLRNTAIAVGTTKNTADVTLFNLVAELLALGQDIDPRDLSVSGWITELVLLRVLLAAVNLQARGYDAP